MSNITSDSSLLNNNTRSQRPFSITLALLSFLGNLQRLWGKPALKCLNSNKNVTEANHFEKQIVLRLEPETQHHTASVSMPPSHEGVMIV